MAYDTQQPSAIIAVALRAEFAPGRCKTQNPAREPAIENQVRNFSEENGQASTTSNPDR